MRHRFVHFVTDRSKLQPAKSIWPAEPARPRISGHTLRLCWQHPHLFLPQACSRQRPHGRLAGAPAWVMWRSHVRCARAATCWQFTAARRAPLALSLVSRRSATAAPVGVVPLRAARVDRRERRRCLGRLALQHAGAAAQQLLLALRHLRAACGAGARHGFRSPRCPYACTRESAAGIHLANYDMPADPRCVPPAGKAPPPASQQQQPPAAAPPAPLGATVCVRGGAWE